MLVKVWLVCTPITFNHGVEGSSPSALTMQIKHLGKIGKSDEMPVWQRVGKSIAALIGRHAD